MTRGVALIGNMNNAHFSLVRYLRDRGVDAHLLLLDNELEHFGPASDTYAATALGFVHQLRWGSVLRYVTTRAEQIRRDLEPYDVLIGCGSAPAYCDKAGRALDVFVPFGGDIWTMLGRSDGNPLRRAKYQPMVAGQERGIASARVVHMAPTNPMYEGQIARYAPRTERWTDPVPVIYDGTYGPDAQAAMESASAWTPRFSEVRASADILLFSSARHFWRCPPHHPAAKGTDRLFRGLARFRARNPGVRIVLATLEYGRQVDESKRLVNRLGLNESVRWFPAMDRKDLMVGLGMADIACGEFENSWIASGVLYEGLVMAKPILAYRDDSLYGEADRYPIMNAREPEEIAARLKAFAEDPPRHVAMGEAGRGWYASRVVAGTMQRYLALITGSERMHVVSP
jgi:hypothetical protein